MGQEDPRDTKQRILDAAEHLFVEQGFESASMRGITNEAGVNLAAINYHFGSKESLIADVFSRRIDPLNRERIELLESVERGGLDADDALERIIDAFVGPALRLAADPDAGNTIMRMVGYAMSQQGQIQDLITNQFRNVFERFTGAIRQVLPHLTPLDVTWRLLFMVGSMAFSMTHSHQMERMTHGDAHADDTEGIRDRLVTFVAAGFRASGSSGEVS